MNTGKIYDDEEDDWDKCVKINRETFLAGAKDIDKMSRGQLRQAKKVSYFLRLKVTFKLRTPTSLHLIDAINCYQLNTK